MRIVQLKYFDSIGFVLNYRKTISKLSEGFVDHESKAVYYTDHEIFNRYFKSISKQYLFK